MEQIGAGDDKFLANVWPNVLWRRKNAPCFFSNAPYSWCKCDLLFKICKPHLGKSKAHSDKCA